MQTELHRHVTALVSDFAAEYGEFDLVGRRITCSLDEYDTLLKSFESAEIIGGAGIRILRDGRMLFVRYEDIDGWIDPGSGRRPGESYADCAKRGVREAVGVEATIDGVAQFQILYLDDPTDRPPIPNPYISFLGSITNAATAPGNSVIGVQWADDPPTDVAYDELTELSLGE